MIEEFKGITTDEWLRLNEVGGGGPESYAYPMVCDSCGKAGFGEQYTDEMFKCPDCGAQTYHMRRW